MSAIQHGANIGTSASPNPDTKTGSETNKVTLELFGYTTSHHNNIVF
jgi:hypothetical protein